MDTYRWGTQLKLIKDDGTRRAKSNKKNTRGKNIIKIKQEEKMICGAHIHAWTQRMGNDQRWAVTLYK